MSEKEYILSKIEIFKEFKPTEDSYYRSIILFGSNTASYKFALGMSLLTLIEQEKVAISLKDLSPIFSKFICEHIKNAPKQTTSNSSTFLEACKKYNENIITKDQLIDITEKNAFKYVLDKFPIVNGGIIQKPFYEYDKKNKQIILTDNSFKLKEMQYFNNLKLETQARWKLVETAWEQGISTNLLKVNYNNEDISLYIDTSFRRKKITSARDALNGYQKGFCFYCFDDITIDGNSENLCDVDHFFPHALQMRYPNVNFDGVWNLVLACQNCNRGNNGKFAKIPALKYLDRLHTRNEYLISSHHPLRETLMQQTGRTENERITFLQEKYKFASSSLVSEWHTEEKKEKVF